MKGWIGQNCNEGDTNFVLSTIQVVFQNHLKVAQMSSRDHKSSLSYPSHIGPFKEFKGHVMVKRSDGCGIWSLAIWFQIQTLLLTSCVILGILF